MQQRYKGIRKNKLLNADLASVFTCKICSLSLGSQSSEVEPLRMNPQGRRKGALKVVIQKFIGVDGMQWKQWQLADDVCNAVSSSLLKDSSDVRGCFSLPEDCGVNHPGSHVQAHEEQGGDGEASMDLPRTAYA